MLFLCRCRSQYSVFQQAIYPYYFFGYISFAVLKKGAVKNSMVSGMPIIAYQFSGFISLAVLKKSAVKNTIVSGMPMAKYSFTVLESIHRWSLFFLAVLQIQTFLAFFDPVYNYSRSESAALLLTEGFCFEQFKRYLLSNIIYKTDHQKILKILFFPSRKSCGWICCTCTDEISIFRCDSDKNSLAIIHRGLKCIS